MSDARPTQQLAADVRAALPERNAVALAFSPEQAAILDARNASAHAALDALVARITDLETRYADLAALYLGYQANGDEYALEKFEALTTAWRAAEAQVAALQQEHDECKSLGLVGWRERAEAAEAALAQQKEEYERTVYLQYRALTTTRQALTAIRDYEWHPGQPATDVREIARRALAATEDTP